VYYNNAQLIGKITSEPKVTIVKDESYILNFVLSLTQFVAKYEEKSIKRTKQSENFHIVCFGHLAYAIKDIIQKWDRVLVTGKIKLAEYQGDSGNVDAVIQITASTVLVIPNEEINSE